MKSSSPEGERSAALDELLKTLEIARRPVTLAEVEVMLAESARPFSREGWFFEVKFDGFRLLAERDGQIVRLRYRSGGDATRSFPELTRALLALPFDQLILDGEVVVLDPSGRPDFSRLQRRIQRTRPIDLELATSHLPVTYFVFDLLALLGRDLRALPLRSRKSLLAEILPPTGPLRYTRHFEGRGEELFREAVRLELEGVMAKRADSPYRAGRSPDWLKLRRHQSDDFVVVGYLPSTKPARFGLRALLLATWSGGRWNYRGAVGTGLDAAALENLRAALEGCARDEPCCGGPVPRRRDVFWTEPALVVEVRYSELTEEGLLRHPVFVRQRTDKSIEELQTHPG